MENNMSRENLIDSATREKLAGRVEVLDKVKELFLLPKLNMMTVEQVADYYEVGKEAIKSCYKRNSEEIDGDGVAFRSLDFWKVHFEPVKNSVRGSTTFRLDENTTITIPNIGIRLFSKRAVLRIGMLLRDSRIAREVRTQLLNTFEHATEEERTQEIKAEERVMANYGWAILYGSREQIKKAVRDLEEYNGRYIKQLEENCDKLKDAVKLLTRQTRKWEPRQVVNRLCRYYAASCLDGCFSSAYRQLYKELLYKKHISLKERTGGKCLLDRVKDNEWDDVIETVAAMCIANGIDVAAVVNEVNAAKI